MAESNLNKNLTDQNLENKIDAAATRTRLSLCDIRELQNSGSDEDECEFEDLDPRTKPKPTAERYIWETCILWHPTALAEFNSHRAHDNQLEGKLSLGKLLTEDLHVQAGQSFNWRKKFILLNVTKTGNDNVRIHQDGSVTISVVETATEINWDVPVAQRTRDLVVSKECSKIAREIMRCLPVPTTLMIWGAEVIAKDDVYILLDVLRGPVSVLIFHEEEISAERVSSIQRNISESELSDFVDCALHYIYNCDDTGTFAVYATGKKTTDTKLVEDSGTVSCTQADIPAEEETDEDAEDDEFFEDGQNEGAEEERYFEIVDDEDEDIDEF